MFINLVVNYLINLRIRILDKLLSSYIEEVMFRRYHLYDGDPSRLMIDNTANVNNALFNVASGNIKIESYVFFGHNVAVITGTHDYKQSGLLRQATIPITGYDITIKKGAWIGTNSTILGPCTIGENSVIAAGSVVIADVMPNTMVGGVPARKIKDISLNL